MTQNETPTVHRKSMHLGFQYANDLERNLSASSISNAVGAGAYTHIAVVLSRTYITTLLFERTWNKTSYAYDVWSQFNEMKKYLVDENLDDFAKLAINTKVDTYIQSESGGSGLIRSAIANSDKKPSICTL